MFTPSVPILTERLLLRPFRDEDLGALFAYHSLPEVARFLYWEARDLEETRGALEVKKGQARLTCVDSTLCLAVLLQEEGALIGDVSLMWRSRRHQQGEVGFVFNPVYGGRGYATEAARAMLALGFEELGLHRIYARCDARNRPSYRLMERLGMRREAHFIHKERFKGEWGNELVYAILREEWHAAGGDVIP